MKYLRDLALAGKRVLVRADLEWSERHLEAPAIIRRLKRTASTLKFINEQGGFPILIGGRGNPNGNRPNQLSFAQLIEPLNSYGFSEVIFNGTSVGPEAVAASQALQAGQLLVLENMRFERGEQSNDRELTAALAKIGDIFILDALSAAEEAGASSAGLATCMGQKALGPILEHELRTVEDLRTAAQSPLCLILGGDEPSYKLKLIEEINQRIDKLLVGGACANAFLAAQGLQLGRSLLEPESFPRAIKLMAKLMRCECQLYLPVDVVVRENANSATATEVVTAQEIPAAMGVFDIGPATTSLFTTALKNAGTIIWSGPMGATEQEDFQLGTEKLAQALGAAPGKTIAAGRSAIAIIDELELNHKFDAIITSGTALLELLAGEQLPVLAAMNRPAQVTR